MKIFNRLAILRTVFAPAVDPRVADQDQIARAYQLSDQAAGDLAKRWQHAFAKDPRLAEDLIRLGGLLELPVVDMQDGVPMPVALTEGQYGEERGKAALAKILLAAGGISFFELNQLMEASNER